MSYDVISIPSFDKKVKQLLKKYPSLKKELSELKGILEENPDTGISLGNNCYKIRLAVSSKGRGKSGGARVITQVYVIRSTVYLLSIYDKSELETLTDQEIQALTNAIK